MYHSIFEIRQQLQYNKGYLELIHYMNNKAKIRFLNNQLKTELEKKANFTLTEENTNEYTIICENIIRIEKDLHNIKI